MARYTASLCRLCRREEEKLFLKGTKCNTEKCPLVKRPYPPGQHGKTAKAKLSNYGIQLREKQKVKRIYGILERQFKRYFKLATRRKGVTGEILLQLLERRLDNVVYRLGWALSRRQARQFVRHNFVLVNARKVNIPSYLVEIGDIISLAKKEKVTKIISGILDFTKERVKPQWLHFDDKGMTAKIIRFPQKADITEPIEEHLIVELYSK